MKSSSVAAGPIGGERVDAADGELQFIHAGRPWAFVPRSRTADAGRTVEAAHHAFVISTDKNGVIDFTRQEPLGVSSPARGSLCRTESTTSSSIDC